MGRVVDVRVPRWDAVKALNAAHNQLEINTNPPAAGPEIQISIPLYDNEADVARFLEAAGVDVLAIRTRTE